MVDFSVWLTLEYDGWPPKIIGNLFHTPRGYVCHFIAIRGLEAEVTISEMLKSEPNRLFFGPCDLAIWQMTPKNNRAPRLYYFKLCASSQRHRWIQTGVTVRKRSIRVKIDDFLSRAALKFDRWSWKTIGHLFYATLSLKFKSKFNHFYWKRRLQNVGHHVSDLMLAK